MNTPIPDPRTPGQLVEEIAQLRARLDEADQTLDAIRHGEVDALVVTGPHGDQVFSLSGAEHAYRVIIETMHEAALTVCLEGIILFCNQQLCDLLKTPMPAVIGQKLAAFVAEPQQEPLLKVLADARVGPVRRRLVLLATDGTAVPVQFSANLYTVNGQTSICLVASDLTELEASANSIKFLREHEQALERAQAELRQQREWFRVTLTSIGDAVIATDSEARITFLNPVAETLTGWSATEAVGQPVQTVFRLINQQTQQPLEGIVAHVLREKCVVALANHSALLTKDGREIPVEDSAAPIKDDAGQVRGVVLVFHDVSAKRRAQEELRARNAELTRAEETLQTTLHRFYDMLAAMYSGILLMTEEGRVEFLNQAFCDYYGLKEAPTDLVGLPSSDLLAKIKNSFLNSDRAADRIREILQRGQPIKGEEFAMQDGRTALRDFVPLSVNGKTCGRLWILTDITARKRAEVALRESQERLRVALDSAQFGTFDFDPLTGELAWDAQMRQIWGVPPGHQLDYAHELARIHPEDRERVSRIVAASLAPSANGDYETEFRIVWPDGTVHWSNARGRVYFQGQGEHRQAVRMVGVQRDITERKRAVSQIMQNVDTLTRLHALSTRILEAAGLELMMQDIMNTAVTIMRADQGTLQLLEGETLRIVAHHGHKDFFLEFFADATDRASVCGEATKRCERVVVEDIECSPWFAGTPSLDVLRKAGVRAVQSTPLLNRKGQLLGILTTQWGVPHVPDKHDLWRIDLLARQAADLIEHKRTEEALRKANEELTHFNRAMVGRELRMIELKKEINELCRQSGQPPRYSNYSQPEQP
jgi:PAS domain S-box-containing protein